MPEESFLKLEDVSFSFGKTLAVKDFSLSIPRGTFATLLGPSGCGKTTLLRLIAGFLEPSKGDIFIDGKNQRGRPVNKRKVGMVFQDYALFPHLTVEKNLLYGLNLQKKERGLDAKKIEHLLYTTSRSLGIETLLKRFPHELSGGQQQRVALGRALILEPQLLLMDEPFSSLDAKLRVQVREELRELQTRLSITTIFVTHDQEEALSLSDTIAVLESGTLQQYGSPKDIYYSPKNAFTADFVGTANFIQKEDALGKNETVLVRPEWVSLKKASFSQSKNQQEKEGTALSSKEGNVLSSSFLGGYTRYKIRFASSKNKILFADIPSSSAVQFKNGDAVTISFTNEWRL